MNGLQRDRMRDALTTATHRPGCHCPVCPKFTTAARLWSCEEPGVSDYAELDTAALLAWRSLYADQLIRVAQAAVDDLLYAGGLLPVDPAVMRTFVAELEPASAEIPPLGPALYGLAGSATPTSE